MNIHEPLGRQFESLVGQLLTSTNTNFVVTYSSEGAGRQPEPFDFLLSLGNAHWAVEVKFYRSKQPHMDLLIAAAKRLVNGIARRAGVRGMLIVSCFVPNETKTRLESDFGIRLVDRVNFLRWVSEYPVHFDLASSILETTPADMEALSRLESSQPLFSMFSGGDEVTSFVEPDDRTGSELCKKLSNVPAGRDGWSMYEVLCQQILEYLFSTELSAWRRQQSMDEGAGRYDLVCRIASSKGFWNFLTQHLNSRYAVFEFKNYSDEIRQGQVLTTEKYLFANGLRRFALIICRKGADPNAIRAAQGAMREEGKLILILDDQDICAMLHKRENGDDPSDYLFEKADDFLLELAR